MKYVLIFTIENVVLGSLTQKYLSLKSSALSICLKYFRCIIVTQKI